MGVNMVGFCISDDEVCREASKQEVIRRYYKAACDYKNGLCDQNVVFRCEALMEELNAEKTDRDVVHFALEKAEKTGGLHCVAIKLNDGHVVTGKSSPMISATSAAMINAIKYLSGIADDIHLISPVVLEPITAMKRSIGSKASKLNLHEALIALSICAATNPSVAYALQKLPELEHCEAHSTKMLTPSEEEYVKRLRINLTCEPEFISKDLYIN